MHNAANRLFSGVGTALGGAVLLTSMSTSAMAADGDAERGFPVITPAWYASTPAFTYPVAPPGPFIDESLAEQGFSASYFLPGGGAPSRGQGDISLGYAQLPKQAEPDEITIDLAAFNRLEGDLQTTFIEVLLIPQEDEYFANTDVVKPVPTVELRDSVLSITRPSLPCVIDLTNYEFQVALLGANGYKYLGDVDVSFGKRPEPDCDLKGVVDPTPSPSTSAAPEKVENSVVQERSDTAPAAEETAAVYDESFDLVPLVVAAGILLLLLLLVVIARAGKRGGRSRFDASGSLVSPNPAPPAPGSTPEAG